VLVIGLSAELRLQYVEDVVRPRQAADVGRLDSVGVLLKRHSEPSGHSSLDAPPAGLGGFPPGPPLGASLRRLPGFRRARGALLRRRLAPPFLPPCRRASAAKQLHRGQMIYHDAGQLVGLAAAKT